MNRRLILPALLLLSLGLRLILVLQGGQYFLGDEARHERGQQLYLALRDGRWADARHILAQPEHAAFTWTVAVLSPVQQALAATAGRGDWRDAGNRYASAGFAAGLLALFPVAIVWLVHRFARAAGAPEPEALWAAGLAALSNTLFYFSRHLLPYDAALAAWLAALVLLHRDGLRVLILSGLLAGLAFHLYNGYWFLVPATGMWLLVRQWRQAAGWQRVVVWVSGAGLGLGLPLLVGTAAGGTAYWQTMRAFGGTAVQGVFAEGWSLPAAYLWHSEQGLGLLVLAAVAGALLLDHPPSRVVQTLAVATMIYGLLCLLSVGLEKFVVYGRTVRPLVPLLCVAGGWAFAQWQQRLPRLRLVLPAAAAALGLTGMAQNFSLSFPREIELQVLGRIGQPKHALSFTGSLYRGLDLPVTRPDFALVDAQLLYPLRDFIGPPAGEVLFSTAHPLTHAPYQYEGHTPRERRLLREHPPFIRLIRLSRPETVPAKPAPGELFTDADRPDGHDRGRR